VHTTRARIRESTIRKGLRFVVAHGGRRLIEQAIEKQVEGAVWASKSKVTVFTDMFDQVYWTKKPAHSGHVGSRGRVLGATFFGMTFVRVEGGPLLAYHVSWHKPASPLLDGLQALFSDAHRALFLRQTSRLHVWDRGGNGGPTLRWAREQWVPYLTIAKGSTHWTRFVRPDTFTATKLPVFVRPDSVSGPKDGAKPLLVIYPARPDAAVPTTRALRFRTTATLTQTELSDLRTIYAARWPNNENAIKALVAVGFGMNRDRNLALTTSRGHDGESRRLGARVELLERELAVLDERPANEVARRALRVCKTIAKCAARRRALDATPTTKSARPATGVEPVFKGLQLLAYNTWALWLAKSPVDAVRAMTPAQVCELLLHRPMAVEVSHHTLMLELESAVSAKDRALQAELVRLINVRRLQLHGRRLSLKLSAPPCETSSLRLTG